MPEDKDQLAASAPIETLCQQAVQGDVQAIERLLWAYHARFLSFVRRKIGVDWRGRIEPEDVLQEAYFDVFDGIRAFAFRDEDSFYRWVTRIIDHRFIDQVRRLRRKKREARRQVPGDGPSQSRHQSLLERICPETTTPSRLLRREEAVNALMTCMAQLPPHYRTVVQRVYLNEEPLAAVAAELNRSEDAVRRMGSRAVECLKACLGRASFHLTSHD